MNEDKPIDTGTYVAPTVVRLKLDDDGYIMFLDGDITWIMHGEGWEAFSDSGGDEPVYGTHERTFPTGSDMEYAQQYAGGSDV